VSRPEDIKPAVLEALSGQKPAVVDVTIDPKEPMQERLRSPLGIYGSY
jgi:thiamine pyrophosphate-dependent acetolactate synthase large subunit-like protein